jgi:thiosulfate/3-mercaptopyruvate sulfurtransferase
MNFVTTDWLDAHLGDADLRVIDASWHLPTSHRQSDA